MFQGSKLFRKISESKERSAFIIRANLRERETAEFSILYSLHEKSSQSSEENVCLSSPYDGFQPACWRSRGFPPPGIPQDSHFGSSSVQASGAPHLPRLLKSQEQLLGGTSSQKKLIHTVISSNRWRTQRKGWNVSKKNPNPTTTKITRIVVYQPRWNKRENTYTGCPQPLPFHLLNGNSFLMPPACQSKLTATINWWKPFAVNEFLSPHICAVLSFPHKTEN